MLDDLATQVDQGWFRSASSGLEELAVREVCGEQYVMVPGSQPKVAIRFTAYGHQSDSGPYPIPPDARIEGAASSTSPDNGGDRHVLVIDRDNNRLYELYRAFRNADGSWNADSGALFGMLMADNGSNWFITGVPDSRWSSALRSELGQVRGSNFEVVQMSGLVVG